MRLENISKRYPGVQALDKVNLEVRSGEIHALLGNNGSGKSTLIKILSGVLKADPGGTIEVDGRPYSTEQYNTSAASALGFTFVHQVIPIFPTLSIAENMAIGRGYETRKTRGIDWRAQDLLTLRLQERFRISGNPDWPIEHLRPADRTLVAIARALQDKGDRTPGLLVLDEPTATLPAPDVELLLTLLRRCASQGQAILFVSHRLDEIRRFADRATALHDGRSSGTHYVENLSESDLVSLAVGQPLERLYPPFSSAAKSEIALELQGLSAWPVQDVSLKLSRGEVLGVAGLIGSGKSELLRAIFGAHEIDGGQIWVDGRKVEINNPVDAVRAGITYVSADRAFESAFLTAELRTNLSISRLKRYWKPPILRHKQETLETRDRMREYLIKAESEEAEFRTLSGGNQQKAILARWLQLQPKVLMLDEPTQGVAIDARAEIYKIIRKAASEGTSVLLVSSDFEELARLSDRVLTINQGQIMSEVRRPELSARRLTELAHFYTEGKA